jgi:hypothetical protein
MSEAWTFVGPESGLWTTQGCRMIVNSSTLRVADEPRVNIPPARLRTLCTPLAHLQHPLDHGSSTSDAPPDHIQRRTKPERHLGTRSLRTHTLSRGPTPTPSQFLISSDESVHTVTCARTLVPPVPPIPRRDDDHAGLVRPPPKDGRRLENRRAGLQCCAQGRAKCEGRMAEPGVLVVDSPLLSLFFPLLPLLFAFASRGVHHGPVVYKNGESPVVLLLGHVCKPHRRRLIGW